MYGRFSPRPTNLHKKEDRNLSSEIVTVDWALRSQIVTSRFPTSATLDSQIHKNLAVFAETMGRRGCLMARRKAVTPALVDSRILTIRGEKVMLETKAERNEVVTNCDHLRRLRFSLVRPWAFTEHGAIMAASVLNSPRAVEMSVFVVAV